MNRASFPGTDPGLTRCMLDCEIATIRAFIKAHC